MTMFNAEVARKAVAEYEKQMRAYERKIAEEFLHDTVQDAVMDSAAYGFSFCSVDVSSLSDEVITNLGLMLIDLGFDVSLHENAKTMAINWK